MDKIKCNFYLILMLVPFLSLAQIPKHNTYLDALQLAKIYKASEDGDAAGNQSLRRAYYALLNKYGITEADIENNIFFKGFRVDIALGSGGPGSLPSPGMSDKPVPKIVEAPTIAPLNWQAAAIAGLSTFMAGRFKQESMHMGINLVFKNIKDEETRQLISVFFPKTFEQIKTLYGTGQNSYYTSDLLYLREIIHSDYLALPQNLVKNVDVIFPRMANEPVAKDMLSVGYNLYQYSLQGLALPDVISSLANETYIDQGITNTIQLADALSNALIDTSNNKTIWVSPMRLLPSRADERSTLEVRFFYGLLYEQLKTIPQLNQFLLPLGTNPRVVSEQVHRLFAFVTNLNNTYTYLRNKDFQLTSLDDKIIYLKELQQSITSFLSNPLVVQHFNIPSEKIEIATRYITIAEAIIKKDFVKAIPLITIQMDDFMDKKYSRSLAFISQLATINSENEMEDLLKAYALPIGSASIKRRSAHNLTLNGYVGFTIGAERAYGQKADPVKTNVGLTAPIGLAYTFNTIKQQRFTILANIIDLGSMVNARIGNDTTSYSNLRFEHFLAPGVGFYWNWKNAPISMGIQYSYIPNLRNIQYEVAGATITETNRNVSRINFSLLVDIPLWTLYNRAKEKE